MECYTKHCNCKYVLLTIVLWLTNCDKYYLQEATVITSRKAPTITTSLGDYRVMDIEVSGSYSGKKTVEYSQGSHTDSVSSNGKFDYECASDPNCNSSQVNNVPYSGENIALHSSQWNAIVQLSLVPFYKKTESKIYRLRILAEAQCGKVNNRGYQNFKFGPTFSSIGNRFAVHPKILLGYSKINVKYQGLIRHETEHLMLFSDNYYTYTWEPDSGSIDSYRFFTEFGATLELPLNRTISILTDVSGTYQYLFECPSDEYIYLAYVEFSPAIKVNVSKYLTLLSGISIPYNPDMVIQLPIQCFAKMHFSVGPYWGKRK